MIEKGKVISVNGNFAEIGIVPGNACSSCPACGSCNLKEGMKIITARNMIKAEPGDVVSIEIANKSGLGAAIILFGLPIALAIIGLIVSAGRVEIYRALITISGLIIGLLLAKVADQWVKNKRNFIPNIIDKES